MLRMLRPTCFEPSCPMLQSRDVWFYPEKTHKQYQTLPIDMFLDFTISIYIHTYIYIQMSTSLSLSYPPFCLFHLNVSLLVISNRNPRGEVPLASATPRSLAARQSGDLRWVFERGTKGFRREKTEEQKGQIRLEQKGIAVCCCTYKILPSTVLIPFCQVGSCCIIYQKICPDFPSAQIEVWCVRVVQP